MPFNGSGTFTRVHDWETDKANGVKIRADRMDAEFDGIATALSNAVTRDGQSPATANLPMGGFKITGLGAATADTDALSRVTADARYVRSGADGSITGDITMGTGAQVILDDSVTTASGGALPLCFDGDTDLGLYRSAANTMHLAGAGANIMTFASTAVTSNQTLTMDTGKQLRFDAGSASLPGLAVNGDTNTGIYSSGAGSLSIVSDAFEVMRVHDTQTISIGTTATPAGKFLIGRGLSGTMATSGTTDSTQIGAFIGTNFGAAGIGIHIGGDGTTADAWLQVRAVADFSLNYDLNLQPNGGQILTNSGSVSLPVQSFMGDTDTGIYRVAANNIGISCGGTKIVDISSGACVFTNSNGTLTSQASGAASSFIVERTDAHGGAAAPGTGVGIFRFIGRDGAVVSQEYSRLTGNCIDATAGGEAGSISFSTVLSGTLASRMYVAQGLVVGAPTGGDKGVGTINATAVYDDNTLLTCYVMEAVMDGQVNLATWDAMAPNHIDPETGEETVRTHFGARKFAARVADQATNPLKLDNYIAHWETQRHLTSLPSKAKWNADSPKESAGDLIQRLWETVEIQAVHDRELRDRINALTSTVETLRTAIADLVRQAQS